MAKPLPYSKTKSHPVFRPRRLTAVDALRGVMHRTEVMRGLIRDRIIAQVIRQGSVVDLHFWKKAESECDRTIIECAAKIAPYESPTKKSIDLENEITVAWVFKSPTKFKNADEWMLAHGVQKLTGEEVLERSSLPKPSTPVEPLFEDEDYE